MTQAPLWWNDLPPGTRAYQALEVTEDLDGAPICLPIHALRGSKPGPTLALLAALHGSEWISIEIVRRVLEEVRPEELSGTLIAVPVCNPVALQALTRSTPDESDNADLNRAFGRPGTWITEQLAGALSEHVITHADALIDFHPLGWGTSFGIVIYGLSDDAELSRRTLQMAAAFGYPSLIEMPRSLPGTASGQAVSARHIPAITPEIGGSGFDRPTEERWVRQNVEGTISVMRYLGMLPGEPRLADTYQRWKRRERVNPRRAGMLVPEVTSDALLSPVRAGQVLGTVRSAYSLQPVEELKAPCDGYLYYVSRDYPVRPGDWAFGVVAEPDVLSPSDIGL